MNRETRIERDSMGEMTVPADALWGASTQRAVENFPIAGRPLPPELIHAYGHVKKACAIVNRDLGRLPPDKARAIIDACDQIIAGELDEHFPVDVYQTGSGTSTNMNVNEVIANRAAGRLPPDVRVHPNDDVNRGQSSNDTFPTAMHVATFLGLRQLLIPALRRLADTLEARARAWDDIVKVGRTHLMDATPIRMGQVFGGYAAQARLAIHRASSAQDRMLGNLPIGGTAVGTGINTHPEFADRVRKQLASQLAIDDLLLRMSDVNHFEAQAAKDAFVDAHGQLKTIAISLTKIANDIRHLGSGPRCGLGELQLPAIQPGSSIMPGKVNPVICESVMQVACRVVGNDATITMAATGGVGSIFELNVAMPVIADAMLESMRLLASVANVFVDKCLAGLEVNRERCESLIEQSLMMVTALAPVIGYDQAAKIAKQAHASGKTIRELVLEQKLITEDQLRELLDPRKMTEPSSHGGGTGG